MACIDFCMYYRLLYVTHTLVSLTLNYAAPQNGLALNVILLRETSVKLPLIKFCFTGVSRNFIITTKSTVLRVFTSRIHDLFGRDKTEENWLDPHSGK